MQLNDETKYVEHSPLIVFADSIRQWTDAFEPDHLDADSALQSPPLWVKKCVSLLSSSLLYAVDRARDSTSISYQRGFAIGFLRWAFAELDKLADSLPESFTQDVEISAEEQEVFFNHLMGDVEIDPNELFGGNWLRNEFGDAVKEIVFDSDPDDTLDFARGLSEGLIALSTREGGLARPNDATPIYLFLVVNSVLVANLNSVTQLHRALTATYGSSAVGERKRIENICLKIGLKFRDPGRPKKNPSPPRPS